MSFKPTVRDAAGALKELSEVQFPEGGDVEGEALNSPNVLSLMPQETRNIVVQNSEIVADFLRRDGNMGAVPNKRGLTAIRKRGFDASLHDHQYEHDRLVGTVGNADFHIDISDPSNEEEED